MSDDEAVTTYRVTHIIKVPDASRTSYSDNKGGSYSNFGLITFGHDCPPTYHNATKRQLQHAESRNYKVIAQITEPVEEVKGDYMAPAIARNRHMHEGTEGEPRAYYHVPVECASWLERFLERQGYTAYEVEGTDADGADPVIRVVTTREYEDMLGAEIAAEWEVVE